MSDPGHPVDSVKAIDPFMEAARGHVPIQTGYGSVAAAIAAGNFPADSPGPHVPRPDCNYQTLFWLSFLLGPLGVDHLYLRSPITGLLKMLFGAGLIILAFLGPGSKLINIMSGLPLLFWWLWDWIQIWSEKERIINYGLCTPGDIVQGIGQGSITDTPSEYRSNSSVWIMISQLFGFLGFTHLATNQTIPGLRIVWIQLISIICIIATVFKWPGWPAAVTFGFMHWIAGLLIAWIWFKSVTSESVITQEDQDAREKVESIINYFKVFATDATKELLSIKHISKKDIRKLNEISHSSEFKPAQTSVSSDTFRLPIQWLPEVVSLGIWSLTPWGKMAALKASVTNPAAAAAALGVKIPPIPQIPGNPAAALGVTNPPIPVTRVQVGGASDLSTESQLLGVTVAAILGGGAIKGLIDFLMVNQ